MELRTGDPGTKDPQGPTGDQQFVELYTLFNTHTFCIVCYIPLLAMANCIVITTSIVSLCLDV